MKKIYIIGGGPAGMMAAISSKTHHPNATVILVDSNPILGKKLKTTGGGRCNVTANVSNQTVIDHIPKNGKFLFSTLNNFNTQDIQEFFVKNGCPLKIEDHDRVFPESDNSTDIIQTLQKELISRKVVFYLDTSVTGIDPISQIISFNTKADEHFDHIILATGGKCVPSSGSNGFGYTLAESCGHTITPLVPAEVPLVSTDQVIQEKALQGLSFKDVTLSVSNGKKITKEITHDLLFTHFGISGPAALRASFYTMKVLEKQPTATIFIDFLPNMPFDFLQKELSENRLIVTQHLMSLGLQKRLIQFLLQDFDQPIQGKDIIPLCHLLKKFSLTIHDVRGFPQAFVTNGGVKLKEVDPKTMKSKLVPFLSFVGELLDINGYTGGFNITAALSTGYTAGKYALS